MGDIVQTARQEMNEAGYKELTTAEEVDQALTAKGTTLVMINSTCGCAGGVARPAATHIVKATHRPDHLVTVFAGQDKEATEKARAYFKGYQPSSPSFALLKDGEIVTMVERSNIEGYSAEQVVYQLQEAFEKAN
ncbi:MULTISPECIES: BrxA/BrxB family bacilliredoxin [Paraliobacillus]|uniref:BrxA/BrxB family bacilliredoxin n=1 Tax=Paraliobacillus TaxID=200903 RepID=UPI000DD3D8DE|nr:MULTISPECIES: BrxA/BrxB family bacilliredoxin [Paraliobacillus]